MNQPPPYRRETALSGGRPALPRSRSDVSSSCNQVSDISRATRSKSSGRNRFAELLLSEGQDEEGSENRSKSVGRRRVDPPFLYSQSFTSGDSGVAYCNVHNEIKLRKGRCPICTAESIRQRWSSLEKPIDADVMKRDQGLLDPIWEKKLRDISERLAKEKAEAEAKASKQASNDIQIDHAVPGTKMSEDSENTPPENNFTPTSTLSDYLGDLQETILQAMQSKRTDGAELDDDISQSSLADRQPATFAEAKVPLPDRNGFECQGGNSNTVQRSHSEEELLDLSVHCESSSSDSSMTMSVVSRNSFESYNSLGLAVIKQSAYLQESDRAQLSHVSPACVADLEKDEFDVNVSEDFSSSFANMGSRSFAETKTKLPAPSSNNESVKIRADADGGNASPQPQSQSSKSRPPLPKRKGHKSLQKAPDDSADQSETAGSPEKSHSFFAALGHLHTDRVHQRRRSSQQDGVSASETKLGSNDTPVQDDHLDQNSSQASGDSSSNLSNRRTDGTQSILPDQQDLKLEQELGEPPLDRKPPRTLPDANLGVGRGPIAHPHYKLGDEARDSDIIVFPKLSKSRTRRSRGRRRRKKRHGSTSDSSSSSSDDDDKECRQSRAAVDIVPQAIGELHHLDAAWVRRSDGRWTYALVADGCDKEIRFVVNEKGATKSFPRTLWRSSVRRIRVLSQRQGDRLSIADKPKRRFPRRSRSSRGGRNRMVSPSPTRRNDHVLSIPSTIEENRVYYNR